MTVLHRISSPGLICWEGVVCQRSRGQTRVGLTPLGSSSFTSHSSRPSRGCSPFTPPPCGSWPSGHSLLRQHVHDKAVAVGNGEIRKLRWCASLLLPSFTMQIFPACLAARSLRAWLEKEPASPRETHNTGHMVKQAERHTDAFTKGSLAQSAKTDDNPAKLSSEQESQ